MLIILVLANDDGLYPEMQQLWRLYMHSHPLVKSYFIKFSSNVAHVAEVVGDTIFVQGTESFVPGCLEKTLRAIEFVLQNEDFQFIFRTNLSSVVDLNALYHVCINTNMDCAGVIGYLDNQAFLSGAGMLLSRKVCQDLVCNQHTLDYGLMDDVSIGAFLRNQPYTMTPWRRLDVHCYEDTPDAITYEMLSSHYHFRCKSDTSQAKTLPLMDRVIRFLYQLA
jgi:hypothetical protein